MMLPASVRILALCQALYTIAISIQLTLTGLAGLQLASNKAWATLPFSLIILTAAITTLFAAHWLQRIGRRSGFLTGALLGAAGGLLAFLAMQQRSFGLLCVAALFSGGFQAFAQYYRLAAADSVAAACKGRAIATVLTGGVLAALLGPWLAKSTQGWLPGVLFGGAYLTASAMGIATAALIYFGYRPTPCAVSENAAAETPRPLRRIIRSPVFVAALANNVVAYAIMVCVMTATPLAMLGCGFGIADGAGVIQWHMLGMFAPALVAGKLVQRFGAGTLALTGMGLLLAASLIAGHSLTLPAFYLALLLLGVGWNFMFVAGSTLLALSYRDSERGKTQACSEFTTSILAASASLAAAPLLQQFGWARLNALVPWLLLLPLLATLYERLKSRGRSDGPAC
ncbi:MFS transporter [Chitinilyticum aquatile]|uniref:MFS transporter n=1 Tax=Chitinilyticum aquatile TaxID=362520 RepID=UPI0004093074|nr:MFS transporter [Chitinilyticum aquatile]